MDYRFIFEQVQKMRPSSFSDEEQHCYNAEKMMLRQFVLMKQPDQIPDHFSVRNMKTWLLKGRSFLEEFEEVIERTGKKHLFSAEVAWTTARLFCLSQMEQEVQEELEKEKRLSQLFSTNVTLDGLEMFISEIHPEAEEDVQCFLPTLHRKVLQMFAGTDITSTGDAKPAVLLELEKSTAALVPEVVDTAFKFLLKETAEDKTDAASAEIGQLLMNSVTTCLSSLESASKNLLLSVCTIAARYMVTKMYKMFDLRTKSFELMDYDKSAYLMYVVQDMEFEAQSDLSNQAQPAKTHPQAEEDVQSFLPTLHQKLLQIFGGINITSSQLSVGDLKPPELLELEERTAAVVPEVVEVAALKFLKENESNGAITQIGQLLSDAAAPCLSRFGCIREDLLLGVCKITARFMVKAISNSSEGCCLKCDKDDEPVRENVKSPVHDIDHAFTKAQSEEEHLEKRKGSEEIPSSNVQTDSAQLEGLVEAFQRLSLDDGKQDSPVIKVDHQVQTDPPSHDPLEGLVEAFQRLSLDDRKQDSAVKNVDHQVQTDPPSQAPLEDGLLGLVEAF